jgi:CRISPR/Cas system CSM-associated protein Csm3 (group 7 of RAMP superfamily)
VFESPGPWSGGARKIQFNKVGSAAVLESGQEERLFTDSDFPRLEIEQDENNGDKSWWCIGYIAYRDQNNINRVTGFCRKWNVITKNWDREKNHDWEYSY